MREFFGFGGYQRPVEGFLSWQHLLFVTLLTGIMIVLAVFFGRKYRKREDKNSVLLWAAIAINGIELLKIVLVCIRDQDIWGWLYDLPLFLCSIQLITIPLAALSKGRLREASLDFVTIFGLLGAVLGTYCAGNTYSYYPVLCFDHLVSGVTHCISGFAALYIMIAGMASMKKQNIPLICGILLGFCVAAYLANLALDYNYMFLMSGDGTPYDILYNLVGGNRLLYPVSVAALFFLYIWLFSTVYSRLRGKKPQPAK